MKCYTVKNGDEVCTGIETNDCQLCVGEEGYAREFDVFEFNPDKAVISEKSFKKYGKVKIPVEKIVDYKMSNEKTNELLVFVQAPKNYQIFIFIDGDKIQSLASGLRANNGSIWEEVLVRIQNDGFLRFRISKEGKRFEIEYKNSDGNLIYSKNTTTKESI